ncbi:MAG: hypothetical protein AAF351_12015 [Pseudomonadota bacterium]
MVKFITDTGGGWNAIKRSVAEKLDPALLESADTMPFPHFADSQSIPNNSIFRNGNLVLVGDHELDEYVDGFLGGRWFGDKVWEFDYFQETLAQLNEYRARLNDSCEDVHLGFQVNSQGARTMHFPRMPIKIGSQTIDVLLDTGAKAQLTERGAGYFGLASGSSVGTSFISESIFEELRAQHPDWHVVQGAESVQQGQTFAMIEVPMVTVAKHSVGPVWFTIRPDTAFVEYMSSMMDQPVYGALGGSGLKYFRLILDYPSATAVFCID